MRYGGRGIFSSFVIAVHCNSKSFVFTERARFAPRDRTGDEYSRRAILNVISHVAAGCHERKVSQGHEFVVVAVAPPLPPPTCAEKVPRCARLLVCLPA